MKMSSLFKKNQMILILLLSTLFLNVSSDSVCDLRTLLMEIKQDLADNRILDCLREIEPLHITEETEDQRNLRLAAQWDSSCAFESSDKWMNKVMKNLGITYLVDSVGDRVAKDFDNQADLCEIVRAALAKNVFDIENLNMQDLNVDDDNVMKFLNMIDCPGAGESRTEGSRICAANGGSYFQKDSWNIFLGSSNIKFLGAPNFNISNKNAAAFDPTKRVNPNTLLPGAAESLKFSRQQFENRQAELAELIDKYSGDAPVENKSMKVNMNALEINEKSDTGKILTNLKRMEQIVNDSNIVYFNKSPSGSNIFFEFPKARMEISNEVATIVFGFYMVNYELLNEQKKATFFMKFNGAAIKESRQTTNVKNTVLTGAFAQKQPQKSTSLSVEYAAADNGSISESRQESFYFASLRVPDGHVFKSFLNRNSSIYKSLRYTEIPNLSLEVRHNSNENAIYVFLYSLTFPIPDANENIEFATRLKYANKEIPESVFVSKGVSDFTVHGAFATNAVMGRQYATVEYKYNGSTEIPVGISDSNHLLSITAFSLPKTAVLEECRLNVKFSLIEGRWKDFGFKKQISIPSNRERATVLVIYHVSLTVNKRKLSVALSVNGQTSKNYTFSSNYNHRANIQGYGVQILTGGLYTFDLKYLVNPSTDPKLASQKIDYDPADKLADESVFMQIILLE